jgi:Ca2+-binding EF-hand superfamily protein
MINKKQIIVSAFLALLFMPVFSQAQTTAAKSTQAKPAVAPAKAAAPTKQIDLAQGVDKMFADLDKDNNKQLSYEEFKNGVVNQRRQVLIIERLRENFKAADKNNNDTLEVTEFNALPGIQGMPAPKPAFATYDLNKDQKMDFREYVEFVGKMSAPPKK